MIKGKRFWKAVEEAVREISREAQPGRIAALQERVAGLPEDAREFFFHSDPFDVALDVLGMTREKAEKRRAVEAGRRRSASRP